MRAFSFAGVRIDLRVDYQYYYNLIFARSLLDGKRLVSALEREKEVTWKVSSARFSSLNSPCYQSICLRLLSDHHDRRVAHDCSDTCARPYEAERKTGEFALVKSQVKRAKVRDWLSEQKLRRFLRQADLEAN